MTIIAVVEKDGKDKQASSLQLQSMYLFRQQREGLGIHRRTIP